MSKTKTKTAREMTPSEMAAWIEAAPIGRRATYANRSGACSDELCRRVIEGELTREQYVAACEPIQAARQSWNERNRG